MRLDYKSPEALSSVVEALLFASDEPLSAITLRAVILGDDLSKIAAEEAELETEIEKEIELQSQQETEIVGTSESPDDQATEVSSSNDASEGSNNALNAAAEAESDQSVSEAPAGLAAPEKKRKKRQLIELVTLHVAIQHLNSLYEQESRAFRIVEIAGGYQFATRAEYSDYVARLSKEKSRRRLSGASLETLAIVAYKQPVSKVDIENIRGVNCDEVLKSLLEKNLVTITGRAEAVGRPLLYGTTTDFLRHFGLHDLGDLPRPREIEELMKEESVKATTLEEAAHEYNTQGEETEGMTIDAALAIAHGLGELEESGQPQAIEFDEEAFANPGHGPLDSEAQDGSNFEEVTSEISEETESME
jgi:segregation and condensation protein B